MKKALRKTVDDFHTYDMDEDEKSVEYHNVTLYLAGIQTVFAVVVGACASVLTCWAIPIRSVSAVRTLSITAICSLMLVRKPLRVGRVRGVGMIFNALRPAVVIYLLALIIEQLLHTCNGTRIHTSPSTPLNAEHDAHDIAHNDGIGVGVRVGDEDPFLGMAPEQHHTLRRIVYHIVTAALIVSAFARARAPRSESDLPFALSAFCLIIVALLPPPTMAEGGSLCEPAGLFEAGERCLRAFLFSAVYTSLIYAAAPSRNVSNELFICVLRATAASVWVLCASTWTLPLAPLQIAIVLFSRLGEQTAEYHSIFASSEGIMKATACVEENASLHNYEYEADHVSCGGNMSDLEGGVDVNNSVASVVAALPPCPKIVGNAQLHHYHHHLNALPLRGSNGLGATGLSFSLPSIAAPPLSSTTSGASNSSAVASAIARESRDESGTG